jgi:hypothetical protein
MANGKIIAVWGSPNSGKTTFATTLATAIYDTFNATVIVLYPDLEAPVLPVMFPNEKSEDLGSVGIPLSKTEIETEVLVQNLVTVKTRQNFGFLGYKDGENKFTYPKYGRAKAEALLEKLCAIADYVIVDCPSNMENNPLAMTALELSWQTLRLAAPDLKCISWYLSQAPLWGDSKVRWDEQIQGVNTPNADVYMPVEEAKSHLKDVSFTVPFSHAIKEQAQKGVLYEPSGDKKYTARMKEIAEKVVTYGQD